MAMNGNNDTPRVPAWKRIGLQLKYAKDTAEQQTNGTQGHHAVLSDRTVDSPQPTKKRKLSPPAGLAAGESTASLTASTSPNAVDSQHAISTTENTGADQHDEMGSSVDLATAARRKSVTFTSETKQEDGFSAKTLFKRSTKAGPAVAESAPEDSSTSSKRQLRSQKRKSAKEGDQTAAAAKHSPLDLQYLQLFHENKASWKFNKNRQTELLKHIFDIDIIPKQFDQAVLAYVAGLQGGAARSRLVQDAFAVLKRAATALEVNDIEAIESMESSEAKRNAYANALKKQLQLAQRTGQFESEYNEQQLEEIRSETPRIERSDDVLALLLRQELNGTLPSTDQPTTQISTRGTSQTSTLAPTTNSASHISVSSGSTSRPSDQCKRKKRKSRTQASSSDDSSSDDSSDDNSASDLQSSTDVASTQKGSSVPSTSATPRRQKVETGSVPLKTGTGNKIIFDDDLLDTMFPKKSAHK